jgi:hypothetical protein
VKARDTADWETPASAATSNEVDLLLLRAIGDFSVSPVANAYSTIAFARHVIPDAQWFQ